LLKALDLLQRLTAALGSEAEALQLLSHPRVEDLLSNTTLLNRITASTRRAELLDDLVKQPQLLDEMLNQPTLLDAWKVLDELNSGLKTDVPTLTKLSKDLQRNSNLASFLKLEPSNLSVWKNVNIFKNHTYDVDFLTWNKTFQDWTSGNGKKLYEHIFQGKTGGTNGISGVHHMNALTTKASGFDVGDIRIKSGTKVSKADGFYEAEIEFWDGANWITKKENGIPVKNGFFPDSWSHSQIMEEVAYARSKVSVGDWMPPVPPKTSSNAYTKSLSNGQTVTFYIGQVTPSAPSIVGNYTISVFPIY
jgi:hypothetical protein